MLSVPFLPGHRDAGVPAEVPAHACREWARPTNPDSDIDAYIRASDARRYAIDPVEGVGGNDLNWNRVDDLIVRLTLRLAHLPPIDKEWRGA
jgi:hypothetical protein